MKALVIPTSGPTRLIDLDNSNNDIRELQGAVGGYIEGVVHTPHFIMYANEEGLLRRLDPNPRASALVMALAEQNPTMILPMGADNLVGDVVIVGSDGSPENADIPSDWVDRFIRVGLWPD